MRGYSGGARLSFLPGHLLQNDSLVMLLCPTTHTLSSRAATIIVGQVGNLRPIVNRPVATPNLFSTDFAGLSIVRPAHSTVHHRFLPEETFQSTQECVRHVIRSTLS